MEPIETFAILITLAAVLSYINHRLLKLPRTIGLMLLTLLGCLMLIALDRTGLLAVEAKVSPLVAAIDFEKVLMEVMLGFLLFAGALHVNINDLLEHKWTIGIFALTVVFCFIITLLDSVLVERDMRDIVKTELDRPQDDLNDDFSKLEGENG